MSSTSKTDKFILTPYKCSDLVAHYAKLKRNEMHHIMMKGSAKVQRQILDLETLNNSQNFIGQAPLQGTTKNTYEVTIFTLADTVLERLAAGQDLTTICSSMDWKEHFSVPMNTCNNIEPAILKTMMQGIVNNLFIIGTEVKRAPESSAEYTNAEYQEAVAARKIRKANQGHSVLQQSELGKRKHDQSDIADGELLAQYDPTEDTTSDSSVAIAPHPPPTTSTTVFSPLPKKRAQPPSTTRGGKNTSAVELPTVPFTANTAPPTSNDLMSKVSNMMDLFQTSLTGPSSSTSTGLVPVPPVPSSAQPLTYEQQMALLAQQQALQDARNAELSLKNRAMELQIQLQGSNLSSSSSDKHA